ncbi:lactococcin 972 family bacteriocin [Streptococcus suis]|uniref:Lactococcin 972 family bacteriocin n=2 Tax=Streptococcus suis TaxID=1307 RepID=A0AAW5LY80_STRSU|nr:lactococcin 972 family bacteriocin [Streptococcus suis]MBS8085707.1 lactococcin 972 family bacteriocin [Streptococcus suis]MCR1232869.1 lactococcin 972 family bacteriocin [Streptococcus suis]QCE39523.1 lactococcin 972 family bacteriocin [Streptococcus suis]WFA76724.1 lactococcin 972 family bacteriocin [Streptococcus suis]HEM3467735.1 lactococcin 972 family bacteriocin [Streptococcus suis]
MKKSFALLGAVLTMFTVIPTVAAAVQYPDGGVWTYGASNGGAFSNYYHGKKEHSSTVVSRKDSRSAKGSAGPGQTSKAYIKTSFGEPAAFYYDFWQ